MSAVQSVDLEDADGLIAADRDGLLRAASTAGAQVRAIAAAHDEGELDLLRGGGRRGPQQAVAVGG
ncbi:TobH protein, partial [Mycobacterium kansasii]